MLTYLDEMAETLELLPKRDRLKELIALGENLVPFQAEEEEHVPGCVSNVVIRTEKNDGKVYYKGYAEALIVRGFVFIHVHALSGLTPEEILQAEGKVEEFVTRAEIASSLIPSRANAFGNVYHFMKKKAQQ